MWTMWKYQRIFFLAMPILLVSMTPEKRKVTINASTKIFKPYEASENVKFKGGVQI